jgi:glycosyltransferase involved in cell wall biosynthesis
VRQQHRERRRRQQHDSGLIAPPRIAIFSPGGVGGGPFSQGQPAIAEMTARLARRFAVTFYSLAAPNAGFRPSGFRLRAPPTFVEHANVRGARWLALAARYAADVAAGRYDVVLSLWGYPMGAFAVTLAGLTRTPAAIMLLGAETADLPAIHYGHLGRPGARRRLFRACGRAAALIAVSRYQLDRLTQYGFRRHDAHVIPIGAEAEMFPFEPKAPDRPLRILHVANLTAVKDQTTLLHAFALLRGKTEARLRIVGEDNLAGRIQQLAQSLGAAADVEFTGSVRYSDMPAHHRWADLFLSTSLSEGQNRGLTEAAMAGVLNVSTPVGHIHDLGEEAAVIVKAGDPADVARRIEAIAADPDGWRRRVAAARAWAAAHDMDWTIERIGEIIEELCSKSAS